MAVSKSHNRPDSVPVLDFGNLGRDVPEDDNVLQNPLKTEPTLKTPGSSSTVSWGTGLATPYYVSKQDFKFGGTVHRPCTHIGHKDRKPISTTKNQKLEKTVQENSKLPPANFKRESENKTQEMKLNNSDQSQADIKEKKISPRIQAVGESKAAGKESLGNEKIADQGKGKSAYWYLDKELREEPKQTEPVSTGPTVDDLAHMQADYTGQSYSEVHSARKYAAEDDLASKQREQVMEQVLVDLLSRHVISDPDQDKDPARANPADPLRMQPGVPMQPVRLKSRRLHDTKVSTVGAVTETNLKSRITFSARVLTQNGRDALRDLFGFYFHHDNTVTVYEYRNFGKNNLKAWPLIVRGRYQHQNGRRKGKDISSNDIALGKNLSFLTGPQKHLPDSIAKHKLITVRICELQDGSDGGVYYDLSTDDRGLDTDAKREREDREIMRKIQAMVRVKLSSRSVSVLMGLGQLFRTLDSSGDGLLSKEELCDALYQFGISIPQKEFDSVWRVVDENDDGSIDYGEFLRAFIGEMNEDRKRIVRKVFKKLDPHKSGSTSLLDMKKLYSAKKHPLVASGQLTQEEMEIRFVDSFAHAGSLEPGRVSYVEFEEYYEGLSIVITSDNDFNNMMRNCWGV